MTRREEQQAKPKPIAALHELTEPQRRALRLAVYNGIMPGEDGVSPVTFRALRRKGLLVLRTSKKGRTAWRATDEGRYLANMALPLFLHYRSHMGMGSDGKESGSGYTQDPRLAMRGEPEVIAA